MKNLFKIFMAAAAVLSAVQCTEEKIVEASLQVSTQAFSEISQTRAVAVGYITINEGQKISSNGFCVSENNNPSVDDMNIVTDSVVVRGEFSAEVTGLKANTTYYGRAYVVSDESVCYGNAVSFTTKPTPTDGWCVVDAVSDIAPNTAVVAMEIADDGNNEIVEYGVCFNATGDPTIEDNKVVADAGGYGFKASLSGLKQGTKYYVRPYFKSASRVTYGEVMTFTTLNFIKTVKVLPGYQAAYMFGQVIMNLSDDNLTTDRGYVWGTSPDPTIEKDASFSNGSGVGSYYNVLGGLKKGTKYYMRAYAKNNDGYYYGENVEFTTRTGDIIPAPKTGEAFTNADMIKVEAGTFEMGEPNTATISSAITANHFGYEPVHTVKLTKDFYMCRYQVTNDQLCAFLNIYQSTKRRNYGSQALYNGSRTALWSFTVSGSAEGSYVFAPSSTAHFKPATHITWGCAEQYLEWLSAELGVVCRMPTEAEWEYAARGGNKSQGYTYSGSNDYKLVAVYNNNTKVGPQPVGSLAPNELGLYDMSGNDFDYCQDFFDDNFYLDQVGKTTVDPLKTGAANGVKVIRGGSFRHLTYLRVSARGSCKNEADCGNHSGFRVVMDSLPESY